MSYYESAAYESDFNRSSRRMDLVQRFCPESVSEQGFLAVYALDELQPSHSVVEPEPTLVV